MTSSDDALAGAAAAVVELVAIAGILALRLFVWLLPIAVALFLALNLLALRLVDESGKRMGVADITDRGALRFGALGLLWAGSLPLLFVLVLLVLNAKLTLVLLLVGVALGACAAVAAAMTSRGEEASSPLESLRFWE